jgi:hypothetical protein
LELNLELLGVTKEALTEMVVERMAEIAESSADFSEGNLTCRIKDLVKTHIDARIGTLAELHVLPRVSEFVDNLVLQETSKWGEKVGSPKTVIEYVVSRCDAYLNEQVNSQGKTKAEDDYSFRPAGTRLARMIHEHLHYRIDESMKAVLGSGMKTLRDTILETSKIKLDEMAKALQVNISIGR